MVEARLQVFDGPGQPFREELRTVGDIENGEALVELTLATICGSDVHTVDGKRKEATPCVLGHEGVGRVTASRRDDADVGDRVTWSIADSCGACAMCTTHGLPQKCAKLFKYGHAPLSDGSGLNGCYASHVVLRRGTHVVRIPDSIPDAVAAPANCALATMVHAIEALPGDAQRVLVQGGGLLGLYGCALLRARGVAEVWCTEIDPRRQVFIERFGGQLAVTPPADVDGVFEVAGNKSVIAEGVHALRAGGFYGLIGLVHPDSALDLTGETIIRKNLTLRGFHNYAPQHLDTAIEFLTQHATDLPFADLVSEPMPLTQIDDAFARARTKDHLRVTVSP